MPESDALSPKQLSAIPCIIAEPTVEAGVKKARISKDTYYQWLKMSAFRDEIKKQRDIVTADALETLKQACTKAVDTLIQLLETTESDNVKRLTCNDILGNVLKMKEMQDLESRVAELEKIIKEKKS